ncbi:PREDICTED: uncharacterized protein LOC105963337 [Erythranthe guttata]|uniref:uncharacterized protein LOC105963337 n=1 Tax=Erythranthe guttata TaxID=4155 RepID=UPI00064D8BFB|nr:PREDICTED: uncharacterized protein LOC105963337 [Erythranthe guttata]|eukprot:XP_012843184.1 PREDICTED: uncharacterized protein LOC105963337 [Erythranthe guttata]
MAHIIAWNCQGLAKPKAVRALRLLLRNNKPEIVFLSEIKTPHIAAITKALSCFSLPHFFSVPPIGLAGGLILAWSNSINLHITSHNQTFINALVFNNVDSQTWQFIGIYCPCYPTGKSSFWTSLKTISNTFDRPWLLMGDFNVVTSQNERKGGNPFASSSKNNLLSSFDDLGLIDLGFHGQPFTWNNKRGGLKNIQQRIDRGVANSLWCSLFPTPLFSIFQLSPLTTPLFSSPLPLF